MLSAEEAARYTYENVTAGTDDWNPRKFFEEVAAPANLSIDGTGALTWEASDYAICYLVSDDKDNVVAVTTETAYAPVSRAESALASYTVKPVNEYGSLGEAAKVGTTTGIAGTTVAGTVVSRLYYNSVGVASDKPFTGFNIVVETYADGSTRTTKTIIR